MVVKNSNESEEEAVASAVPAQIQPVEKDEGSMMMDNEIAKKTDPCDFEDEISRLIND